MSRANYKTWWKRFDEVPHEWLQQTARWLDGMSSSDGSILVTHNDGGINLQVGGITDGRTGSGAGVSATPVDLDPTPSLTGTGNSLSVSLRRPRVTLVNGTQRIIQASATANVSATLFTVSTSTVDLLPESRVNGLYLQHRQKLVKLTISGNPPTISLAAAATYSDWVNGISLCTATNG